VRYDNKVGKRDHKHLGNNEMPDEFESIVKLLEDFFNDVREARTL